jgi:hypothetical protein
MKNRKEKSPFAALSNEFKDAACTYSKEEINDKIASSAKIISTLKEERKNDQQLAEAKENVKQCGQVYREGIKENELKIRYLYELLSSRGQGLDDQ